MRFEIKAQRDFEGETYGDRVYDLKKGETMEVSAQGFEIAMRNVGGFEKVREIPENEGEEKRLKRAQTVEKLSEKNKPQLQKQAERLDIAPTGKLKDELVEQIAEAQIMEDVPKKGGKK